LAVDWLTLSASVGSSLVGGGLIGGLVALRVAGRESDDRRKVLELEREKWEHQRDLPSRDRQRQLCEEAMAFLDELRPFAGMIRSRMPVGPRDVPEYLQFRTEASTQSSTFLLRALPLAVALRTTISPEAGSSFEGAVVSATDWVAKVVLGDEDVALRKQSEEDDIVAMLLLTRLRDRL
jgi:hypothetical protein